MMTYNNNTSLYKYLGISRALAGSYSPGNIHQLSLTTFVATELLPGNLCMTFTWRPSSSSSLTGQTDARNSRDVTSKQVFIASGCDARAGDKNKTDGWWW